MSVKYKKNVQVIAIRNSRNVCASGIYIFPISVHYYNFATIGLSAHAARTFSMPRVTCKFNVFARAYVIPYYRPDARSGNIKFANGRVIAIPVDACGTRRHPINR